MAGGIGSMEFLVTQILLLFQKAIDGFGFSPTEQQLINHLKSENPGRTEHFCIIPKLGNITDFDPWQLPGEFTGQSILPSNSRGWWFICSQTQNQRTRITRKTPCGSSWKVTGKPRDITIDGKKIGFKKILGFPEEKAKKDWIIHEYHLPQDSPNSGNDVLCHLTRKQDEKADNSTTGSEDGKFTLLEAEQWCNQFNDEPEGISPELHSISWPQFMQMLQRELESLSIRQSTDIGSSYVPNADLSNAEVQNGEEPDKSIELESLHRRTECDDWAASMIIENPSDDTEVQRGEEPRLEKDHQETAATSTEPCITSDEDAVRAKNGQISTMKDCRSKLEPLDWVASLEETEGVKQSSFNSSHLSENRRFSPSLDDAAQAKNGQISTMQDCRSKLEPLDWVASLEETEGIKQSTFNSSHLSENRRFSPSLDDAAQAKGLEHEEHKLAGISPKRRRLDVSDDGPQLTSPKICFFFSKKRRVSFR